MQIQSDNLRTALWKTRQFLLHSGIPVSTATWQDIQDPPKFLEVTNLSVLVPMADDSPICSALVNASQPWAEEHFVERVSGFPLNPPPSHKRWAKGTDEHMSKVDANKFSHSYPERMWSRKTSMPTQGIRYDNGDLSDAIKLLRKDPTTRQCYVPIYYPEDLTASNQGERVPCTLGWHFMVRGNRMMCFYPMRSCDAVRHVHNDWYFANMLTTWLLHMSGLWEKGVRPGNLHFCATSFHCFLNDKYTLEQLIMKGKDDDHSS